MHLFYTPDTTTNEYTLPEEESKHCVKVLRLEIGDEIFLVDGKVAFTVARLFKRTLNAVKSDALKKQKITENGITIFTLPLPRQKYWTHRMVLGKMHGDRDWRNYTSTLRSLGTQSNQRRTAGKSDYFCHETILESLPATTQSHDRIFLFCKKQSKLIEVYRPLRWRK